MHNFLILSNICARPPLANPTAAHLEEPQQDEGGGHTEAEELQNLVGLRSLAVALEPVCRVGAAVVGLDHAIRRAVGQLDGTLVEQAVLEHVAVVAAVGRVLETVGPCLRAETQLE